MTLLKYFNRIEPSKEERIQSVLPKPDGPLVLLIPCSTIESANSAIREFLPNVFTDAGHCRLGMCDIYRYSNISI